MLDTFEMRAALGMAVVACLALACGGDKSGSPKSGGGSSGSGGTDTAGSGGTDTAGSGGTDTAGSGGTDTAGSGGTAGLSRGAIVLDFQSPEGCADPAMRMSYPEGDTDAVDASGVYATLEDGSQVAGQQVRVSCVTQVNAVGSWMVEGQIDIGSNGSVLDFGFYSHGTVPNERRAAGFSIRTEALSRQHSTQTGSESGAVLTLLEPGKMQGTLDVPHLFNFDDDTECVLGLSHFYFENCDLSY